MVHSDITRYTCIQIARSETGDDSKNGLEIKFFEF